MNPQGDEDIHEIPPYPDDWNAEKRVAAYWHALGSGAFPTATQHWHNVWASVERERERRAQRRAKVLGNQPPTDTTKVAQRGTQGPQ